MTGSFFAESKGPSSRDRTFRTRCPARVMIGFLFLGVQKSFPSRRIKTLPRDRIFVRQAGQESGWILFRGPAKIHPHDRIFRRTSRPAARMDIFAGPRKILPRARFYRGQRRGRWRDGAGERPAALRGRRCRAAGRSSWRSRAAATAIPTSHTASAGWSRARRSPLRASA